MVDTMEATFVQEVHKGDKVTVDIAMGVLDGVSDPRLSGQMDDLIDRMIVQEPDDCLPVYQVRQRELESRDGFQSVQPRSFQVDTVVVVQVIQPEHTVPVCEQSLTEMESDESGGTGD